VAVTKIEHAKSPVYIFEDGIKIIDSVFLHSRYRGPGYDKNESD